MSPWEAVSRPDLVWRTLAGMKRCPSILETHCIHATDSLHWIGSHPPEVRNLIMVDLEGEEVHRAPRFPVWDILAERDHAKEFQLMEDCIA
jgi:hypothetical protein